MRVDHDYLRFPVYALTGCALILGLIESIVLNFKMEHVPTLQSVASGRVKRSQKMRRERCECRKFRRKANKLVGPVEEDVRALLGVSVVRVKGSSLMCPRLMLKYAQTTWKACSEWLIALVAGDAE